MTAVMMKFQFEKFSINFESCLSSLTNVQCITPCNVFHRINKSKVTFTE